MKTFGYFLLIGPFVGMLLVLIAFALLNGVFVGSTEANFALGVLGFISVVGILIGTPVGLFLVVAGKETGKFSMKGALLTGWEYTKKKFWFFAGTFLVFYLVNLGPMIIEAVTGGKEDWEIFYLIFSIVFFPISLWIGLGWINICLRTVKNVPVGFKNLFPPFKTFLSHLGASILYGIIVMCGLVLFIVPGIIWSLKFILFPYFILEGSGPIEALKKSAAATRGAKMDLLIFGIALSFINLLGTLALLLGLFVSIPVTGLASAYVYQQLAKSK